MEVVATDVDGYNEMKSTPVRGGTKNPVWNDYLVFSKHTWKKMTIKIMDDDGAGNKPDPLCPTQVISLEFERTISLFCHEGKATVQFTLEV